MDLLNQSAESRNAQEGNIMEEGQHLFQYVSKKIIPAGIGSTIQDEIKIDSDSFFDIQKMYNVDGGDFKIMIRDTYLNYTWMSYPAFRECVFGTIEFPSILYDPILLPPTTSILVEYTNLVAAPNPVECVFEGARRYSQKFPSDAEMSDRSRKRWFQYVFNVSVPASNKVTKVESINADSFFLTKKLIHKKTGDAQNRVAVSTLGNRNLSNVMVSLDNMYGRALRPNSLPRNQRIPLPPNSVLQFEVQDLSGADNEIQLVFEGVKNWRRAF